MWYSISSIVIFGMSFSFFSVVAEHRTKIDAGPALDDFALEISDVGVLGLRQQRLLVVQLLQRQPGECQPRYKVPTLLAQDIRRVFYAVYAKPLAHELSTRPTAPTRLSRRVRRSHLLSVITFTHPATCPD